MTKFIDIVIQEFYEVKINLKFEFLKIYRRNKMRNMMIIAIVIAELFYLIPVLSDSDFPEESLAFVSNLMGSIGLMFVLFASFLGADAINREHTKGTDLLIYPLPQRRSNVIIAKYLSHLVTGWLGILLYYLLVIFHTR
ncbi:MAG: ABC transporter permease, partial [Candidatus Heimdallarchaeota archaeon]|nr:ABC transporter permease [Candidatus Heimdallarchaeota archaeon]